MIKITPIFCALLFSSIHILSYADNLDDWKTLTNKSTALSTQKQYEQALELSSKALEFAEQEPKNQNIRAVTSLIQLGWIHQSMNQFPQAESFYVRAFRLQAKTAPTDQYSQARILMFLAKLYSSRGDITKAEPIIASILERFEKYYGTYTDSLLKALQLQGAMYLTHATYQQAAPALMRALTINEELEVQIGDDLKNSLNILANKYRKANRIDEAIDIEKRLNKLYTLVTPNKWNSPVPIIHFLHCKIEYPKEALRRNLEGKILFKVLIDIDGELLEKEKIRSTGSKILDDAVLNAVSLCPITAAMQDGNPIRAWADAAYQWKLN